MRTQRLELRLTDDERQLDSAAARAVGETLSDFFRRAASARAQDVLTDQQQIVLSEDEAQRFLDALDEVDEKAVGRLRELREARLAVDRSRHREGIGAALLTDALVRVVRASEQVGVRAVVVHAADENAAGFYERFGLSALSTAPRTLMITLAAVRAAGYA